MMFRRQTAVLTVELRGRPMAVSRTDADGVSRRRLVMKIAVTITFYGTGLFSSSMLKARAIISAAVIPKAMEAVLLGLDPPLFRLELAVPPHVLRFLNHILKGKINGQSSFTWHSG